MGGKTTKQASGNLLEGTTWLRTVVQHYQKRRHGVSGFDRLKKNLMQTLI